MRPFYARITIVCLLASAAPACKQRPDQASESLAAGPAQRKVLGPAAPYPAETGDPAGLALELSGSLAKRRAFGWEVVRKILKPVPLAAGAQALAAGAALPRVPTWLTWYTGDEMQKIFESFYTTLQSQSAAGTCRLPASRDAAPAPAASGVPPCDLARLANQAMTTYGAQPDLTQPVQDFYQRMVQLVATAGGEGAADAAGLGMGEIGVSVVLFSPAVVTHYLTHYPDVLSCMNTFGNGNTPPPMTIAGLAADSFGSCFGQAAPFPVDAVSIKARWQRVVGGATLKSTPTDAASLARWLDLPSSAWRDAAGTNVPLPDAAHMYRVRINSGGGVNDYALIGLHVTTKEVPAWVWVSLWWDPAPDRDFGADRPDSLCAGGAADCAADDRFLTPFRNYKMCVVSDFTEGDPLFTRGGPVPAALDPVFRPLSVVYHKSGGATWCSNQYIEFGTHEVRSNCIGCHQFAAPGNVFGRPPAGSPAMVTDKRGNSFAADFMWSFAQPPDELAAKMGDSKGNLDSVK